MTDAPIERLRGVVRNALYHHLPSHIHADVCRAVAEEILPALATIEPIPSAGEGERATLEMAARGFRKHERFWKASAQRTHSLEDGCRAENAGALAAACEAALATLPSEPLRDDVTRGPTCANPCCASPAAGFPVIYFGPAQEPRRYRLEVPKGMCGECQPLFQAGTFFTDASRVEMSRMIDEQGLALPDYDRLAVDWIGVEDPAFAEVAALREARLWFG